MNQQNIEKATDHQAKDASAIRYDADKAQQLLEYTEIMEGLEDIGAGRTVDGETAIRNLRRKYLTDSLTGILKEDCDLDTAKVESMRAKYGVYTI